VRRRHQAAARGPSLCFGVMPAPPTCATITLKSDSFAESNQVPDYVRRMVREDANRVLEIDREAFPTEWPAPNFKREMENRLAHYIVACRTDKLAEESPEADPPEKGFAGLVSRLRRLFSGNQLPQATHAPQCDEVITGFAGFWVMADEAHITSIATRAVFQRQGIGELLLQSVIDLAAKLKARVVTLEVRVSNTVAQDLYAKYGFSQVGLRRGYYTDNREDALVMSTDNIDSAAFQARMRELKHAYQARWGAERYQLSR